MPTLVLAACAAAGRILFAPIPDFKPLSAIAIIAGATLGPRNGFMVGALAALTSNFFFGQGLWSPWQMYAWGVVGYVVACWLGPACSRIAQLAARAYGRSCSVGLASGASTA
ncbi:MAG: ECF transporter S component [Collinsella sp.]